MLVTLWRLNLLRKATQRASEGGRLAAVIFRWPMPFVAWQVWQIRRRPKTSEQGKKLAVDLENVTDI